jgi:hypothetical protein
MVFALAGDSTTTRHGPLAAFAVFFARGVAPPVFASLAISPLL